MDALVAYLGFSGALIASFYKFMTLYERNHMTADSKATLSLWLLGANNNTWSKQFCDFFDSIFGSRHITLKCLVRSITASIISVITLYVLLGPTLGLLERIPGDQSIFTVLTVGATINILPDYVSLFQTRWMLQKFQNLRSKLGIFVILIMDFIVSGMIIWVGILTYHILRQTPPPHLFEVLGGFTIYSIFFYSTFFTSIWAWLYLTSSYVMRLFSSKLSRVLNVETYPLQQLALVGVVILGGLLILPRTIPSGTVSNIICKLHGNEVLYHCIRTAKTSEAQEGYISDFIDTGDFETNIKTMNRFFVKRGEDDVAIELFNMQSESCALDNASSCRITGLLFSAGLGVQQSDILAADFYRKACRGNEMTGCRGLGFLHERGQGVEQDYTLAVEFNAQACQGGDIGGCNNLGNYYEKGHGIEQSYSRAAELYNESCQGSFAIACKNLGQLYQKGQGVEQSYSRAAKLLDRACQGGDWGGCAELGILYAQGKGVDQSSIRAIELHEKACTGGDFSACNNLGAIYQNGQVVRQSYDRAAPLFNKSCQQGEMQGRRNLARLYFFGHGVEKSENRAGELYDQSCRGGVMESCRDLGLLYESGLGVEKSVIRASELYDQACQKTDDIACDLLEELKTKIAGNKFRNK